MIRVSVDTSKIGGSRLMLTPALRRKILNAIGKSIVDAILENVQVGVNADGEAMEPYSKGYIAWKMQLGSGRVPMGDGDWMRLTGQMMKSMKCTSVDENRAVIEFVGQRTVRYMRPGGKRGKGVKADEGEELTTNNDVAEAVTKRKNYDFFGVTEEAERAIDDLIGDMVDEALG